MNLLKRKESATLKPGDSKGKKENICRTYDRNGEVYPLTNILLIGLLVSGISVYNNGTEMVIIVPFASSD